MQNVIKFFTFIFICLGVFYCYSWDICLADTFQSEVYKSCSQVCADNGQLCQSISNAPDIINNYTCKINEDMGGGNYCENISGNCDTILNDDGFDGCLYGSSECVAYPDRHAQWTNCNCVKKADFSILEVQSIDGKIDYMTGTSGEPFINSYQPFENYIFHDNNNHNAGDWTNIYAVLFSAMTAAPPVGADTHINIYLKMALGNDNYTANCDGVYGVDWAWSPIGQATIPADGIFHDTAVFKDQNEDQCAYYNETYFCTICGIGLYTYPDEYPTWVKLGAADYPNFQLDIAGERVSDYSLWFLLAGTKNQEPASTCNCASSSNIFYQGVCEAFCFLFVPTDYGLTSFQNNYDNLKQTFPFNTYFQLTTAVQGGLNDANLNTTTTIGVPMVRKVSGAAQFYILPVLSSSSMPNAIGGTNANFHFQNCTRRL